MKCADVPDLQSLKITLLKFTHSFQRPNIPSLSRYSLLLLRINYSLVITNSLLLLLFLFSIWLFKKFAKIFIRGSVISRFL